MIPGRHAGAPLARELRKLVAPALGDWAKTLQLALLLILVFGCLTAWTLVVLGYLGPSALNWDLGASTLVGPG